MSTTVTIIGNLTADPELISKNGRTRARFSVAENVGRDESQRSNFYDCSVWQSEKVPNHAENVVESLRKGDNVIVTGTLAQYEAPYVNDAGEDRYHRVTTVNVWTVGPTLTFATAAVSRNPRDYDDDATDPARPTRRGRDDAEDDRGRRGRATRRDETSEDDVDEAAPRAGRSRAAADEEPDQAPARSRGRRPSATRTARTRTARREEPAGDADGADDDY